VPRRAVQIAPLARFTSYRKTTQIATQLPQGFGPFSLSLSWGIRLVGLSLSLSLSLSLNKQLVHLIGVLHFV
jgi:hypothetical protein